ncbi:MAG: DUF4294 domain-containing protein [Prevotellaceae bacterium]|jgi:hypothetical protein|nr:DUF4294 domain-containing protein [Prevotellaceae bacterium]
MKTIKFIILTSIVLFLFGLNAQSQEGGVRLPAHVSADGDTVPQIVLPMVYVFPTLNFSSKKQEQFYWKTVRDVKRTLPYAKAIGTTLLEINTAMEGMSEKERKAYMKSKEDDLIGKYEPELKKLTLSQGKMLIRLVDRECEKTSYELIKEYRGGFRAFFWQGFARLFGANLKTNYEKNDKDKIVERVILLVEAGQL